MICCGIFGALHYAQGVIGMLQVTGIGLILTLVFIKTRSIVTVILAHFMFDFAQFQLIGVARHALEQMESTPAV